MAIENTPEVPTCYDPVKIPSPLVLAPDRQPSPFAGPHAVKADMDEFAPALPPRPESALTLPEQFTGLFDSRRDYLTQLAFYKRGSTETGP